MWRAVPTNPTKCLLSLSTAPQEGRWLAGIVPTLQTRQARRRDFPRMLHTSVRRRAGEESSGLCVSSRNPVSCLLGM